MRKVVALTKAVGGFVAELFRAKARVVSVTPNGHTILEGWDYSPEERIIEKANSLKKRLAAPRLALHCYEGPHQGQLFFLGERMETLGRFVDSDVVLTPATEKAGERFRMLVNGHITLMGEGGSAFLLNGMTETKAELFDYDELELLGNKFLVLTLKDNEEHL